MKKLLFVLFCFIGVSIQAQESSFYIEAGYLPSFNQTEYRSATGLGSTKFNSINFDKMLYTEIGGKVYLLKYVYLGGSSICYMYPVYNTINFFPTYMSFQVDAGFTFDKIEIGYKHRCSHPMVPSLYFIEPLSYVDSSYDKVFVRYSIRY